MKKLVDDNVPGSQTFSPSKRKGPGRVSKRRKRSQVRRRERKSPRACRCQICAQQTPKFDVRESTIPGAGNGLFAGEDIGGGSKLGTYMGLIHESDSEEKRESEEDDDEKMTRFTISKG